MEEILDEPAEGETTATGAPKLAAGYARIAQLIGADRCVVLDGAIGTELIDVSGARPEVEAHLWGITAIIDDPAKVKGYVDVGADVLTTDTWSLAAGR